MPALRQSNQLLCSLAAASAHRPAGFSGCALTALTITVIVGSAISPVRLEAQESGMLTGKVATVSKVPLPTARVSVVGTTLGTLADSAGTFRVSAVPFGAQMVEVKLLGYATILVPVQIDSGKIAIIDVTLVPSPVPLETVKVVADTFVLPEMRRFAERRARGGGKFFTREEIDRMEAQLVTDILRHAPGMQIETLDGAFGPTYSVQSSRNLGTNGTRSCQMQFYVNGVPFTSVGELAINHFVSPGEVAAMEIYTGASQIPPEYNSSMYNARCGLVLIWTRISTSPNKSN